MPARTRAKSRRRTSSARLRERPLTRTACARSQRLPLTRLRAPDRRARARRSGSRSALRPCAGCRRPGRARGPRSTVGSRRSRPTSTSSRPAALPGDGKSSTTTDGAAPSNWRACSGERSSSNSAQTASAWPTMTGTRTHIAWIGRSGSSMIFWVSARSFDSSSNSSPSKLQSIRRSWSAGASFASRSIACAPAPDTDWYVATRTRTRPAASWSGFRTHVSGIAQQFGLATMPVFSSARPAFTSGTTSGTPGSSR